MKLNERMIDQIIRDDIYEEDIDEVTSENRNILIVEGKSDREIIERIAYNLNLTNNFEIIEMKGVSNFIKLYRIFKKQENLNVRYLTDNDASARRWIEKYDVQKEFILTKSIYSFVKPDIKEMEEYITNTAHFKHKPTKKKLLQRIWSWKNINRSNVQHLINVLNNSFNEKAFIKQ